MNNDLISREALKKALKSNCDLCHDKNTNWCEHCCPLNDFEDLIDNAPPVKAFTEEDMAGAYNEGYACGGRESKRSQGEWYFSYEKGWECNQCHEVVKEMPTCMRKATYNFCPNCGAKMQKGGAE